MARFSGRIGFAEEKETAPGVVQKVITERMYFGDIVRNRYSPQPTDTVNGTISIQNQISIVADPFTFENYFSMQYVVWKGFAWTISAIDIEGYPRMLITLGGAYNGPKAETT